MSAARARSQRVLRCECGQFVRLDRALAELHSDPTPAPVPASELSDADDDDETHMFSSLEAIAALGSAASPRASRASLYDGDDAAAARVKSSPANLPLPSTPPARPSSPVRRSLSPPPAAASTSDKPLWYVDLGGTETVEMTIEQLIIARRSGKLGEGALVWRAGMARWRSIGSLIPAAGSGAPRSAAPPAAPVRATPLTAQPLGSYERPVPTLEFALEKPELSAPRERPARSLSSANLRPASQSPGPRVRTPIPRVPGSNTPPPVRVGPARAPSPAPVPGPVPAARVPAPTPIPARSSAPPARAVASVMPFLQRSSPLPPIRSLVPVAFQYPWRGQRPRWLSVSIAVLICIAASGSGAFLVRALKIRRQPLSLSPTLVSPAATVVGPNLSPRTLPATPAEPTAAVVDIDSLSVEHPAPRPAPRAVTLAPRVPTAPINADKSPENADEDAPTPTAAPTATAPAPAARKPKANDGPAPPRADPALIDAIQQSVTKKPAPVDADSPGF